MGGHLPKTAESLTRVREGRGREAPPAQPTDVAANTVRGPEARGSAVEALALQGPQAAAPEGPSGPYRPAPKKVPKQKGAQ